MERILLAYYADLYASDNSYSTNGLIQRTISASVSAYDNDMLTKQSSMDEIKVVFSMNGDGAPSPDGFGDCFYQRFWDTVSLDVFNSVTQFFSQGWLLPNLNSNLVVLIPKFKGAGAVENFRPIALANY